MSGKPVGAPKDPSRSRHTRIADGPVPAPRVSPSDIPTPVPPAPPAPPRVGVPTPPRAKKARNTVIGTPDVLAEAARPQPPRDLKVPTPSGRHKTVTDAKGKLPAALAAAQPPSQQQTVIGPAPTAPPGAKPPARRGLASGPSPAAGLENARTLVPGDPSTAAPPLGTRTPDAAAEPEEQRRLDATRDTIALAKETPAPARPGTQPVVEPMGVAPTVRRSNTRPLGADAEAERRGTRLHGATGGLVNAGTESPKLRLVPGKVIPGTRYKILKWLGEGGMGVVYEAAHVDIERRSALKILRFDLSKQPTMVQVFRDEARAASRLGSPHIVEIYDFGDLPDGRLFFAMELIDGHDLVPTEMEPTMDAGRLIGILRQVCKGLAAAHAASVVHRDVKPENIILADTEERKDVAKLVDFGISAMVAAGQESGGGVAGTPHYMAPEQILGEAFDHRLDIYALGATTYELLVGQPPFDSDNIEELLQMQVDNVPPPPRGLRPDLNIPAELESVVLRCLAKQPDQRYENMAELEGALCEAQIAAGLTTPWDDLAVPELADPERRASIIARMPNATAGQPKRSLLWPIVAGASTLAAAGLAAFLAFGGPTEEELTKVNELTAQAKEAAADQSWVVPTATRADGTTAYSKVLELEALEGPAEDAADERGAELRTRFATALVGSADPMWDQGAKMLARQYYLYALTFDETNGHALDRLDLPTLALAKFLESARTGDFSEGDALLASLAAAEVEQNPEKKKVLQDAAAEQVETADLTTVAAIAEAGISEKVSDSATRRVRRGGGAVPKPTAKEAPSPDPDTSPDADADADAGADADADEVVIDDPAAEPEAAPEVGRKPKPRTRPRPVEQDSGSLLGKAKRDPKKAADLATQGMAALKSGQRQKATSLFNQAIAYDRRNAKALMGLADIYFDTGSNQKAINYAEKAVAAAPNSGGYRVRLGDAYFRVLRYKDAKEQYQRAKNLGASRADQRLTKVNAKLGG